ncbi:MAG: TIGR00730 family Rossman fold protein [Bacteroidales bacterium]|nr:TIGR00730 family Rossman fold protein [Bacteroidales bacterium]
MNQEDKIREAFKHKSWNEIKTEDSWRIFKVMAEFVDGFEKLGRIGPSVAVFGSARTRPDNPYYQIAEEVGFKLTQLGYGVITGGGPGIMEAANKGARRGKGKSIGINIDLPHEQGANPFIDNDKLISFDFFFVRKTMFMKYAQGFIVLPGGFGTFDELFEAMTLIQTGKIGKFPIVLVGKSYWNGLIKWMKEIMHAKEHNVNITDFNLFSTVDTAEDAVKVIDKFYEQYLLSPNF